MKLTIQRKDGPYDVVATPVEGTHFAFFPDVNDPSSFSVTHVPTGWKAALASTAEKAKACAEAFSALPMPWGSSDAEEVRAVAKPYMKRIRKIVADAFIAELERTK